jgi:tungstate transport system ATP-binding protein
MAIDAKRNVLPITANGVRLFRDGQLLLDVVELSLQSAGPTVIMGPNGAGKSLLLRVLHGLEVSQEGQVTFGGKVGDPQMGPRQAMVFQRPVLLRRSVWANIEFALKCAGVPKPQHEKQISLRMQEANLSEKAKQPARSLSGGEQQLLAMVRAMAMLPEILFLDEPTSHLDPSATLRIEQLILRAAESGTKIVMVSHDLGQAKRIAQDIVFCHGGKIAEHCEAAEFFKDPKAASARSFLAGELVI